MSGRGRGGPPRGPNKDKAAGQGKPKTNFTDDDGNSRRIKGTPNVSGLQGTTAIAGPQSRGTGPMMMTVQGKVQVQSPASKSLWGLTAVPTLPEFHPLERTAVFITNTRPDVIAGRIANVLKDRSIQATYDDDKAKATCVTLEGVDFRIRLYRGRAQFSHGIIVEVQRRFGSGMSFHDDSKAILDAAEGKKPSTPQKYQSMRALPEVSDDESDDEDMPPPPSGASSLSMVSKMLQIPGFDGQYLGLQTLSTLVDGERMTPESATRCSQALLQADSDVGAQVFSYIINRKVDDESYRELRTLSLGILSLSLKYSNTIPEFIRPVLRPILIEDIKDAPTYPRAACCALGAMKYFVPGDEDIIELNEIFQEALLIGEERYKHLENMANACIKAIR